MRLTKVAAATGVLAWIGWTNPIYAQALTPMEQLRTTHSCQGCDLSNADLRTMDLSSADLSGANLGNANLNGVNLTQANLSGATLYLTSLEGAILKDANLQNANLKSARLSNATLTGANLSDANLSYAVLTGGQLTGATLTHANLSSTTLNNTDFSNSQLGGSDLSYADLTGATLRNADLSQARLSGANLSHAILDSANLSGAELDAAKLKDASFINAKLPESNPLKTAQAIAPDTTPVPTQNATLEASGGAASVSTPLSNQLFPHPTAFTVPRGTLAVTITPRIYRLSSNVAGANNTAVYGHVGFTGGVTDNFQLSASYQRVDSNSPGQQGPFIANRQIGDTEGTLVGQYKVWHNEADTLALAGVVGLSVGTRKVQFSPVGIETNNDGLVAMLQAPFSAKVANRAVFTIAPTIAFFPDSNAMFLSRPPIANPGSFGPLFGVSGSASYSLSHRISLWADAFIPLTGNNSVSQSTGLPNKEIAFNAGLRFLVNPRLALDVFATNTQGSLGPLALTTQPGSIGAGANLVFLPNVSGGNREIADNFNGDLKASDSPLTVDGFGFLDGGTVPKDRFLLQTQAGSQGYFASLRLGLVKDFDLGGYISYSFGKVDESEQGFSLKTRFLNQDKGAPLTASLAVTLGQANEPFLNFTNNNSTAFATSGLSKNLPFIANEDNGSLGRLFIATFSLPLHYRISDRAAVWFTPVLGYVQRDGLQEGGFNTGASFSFVKDVSLVAEIGADFVGQGNSFSGTRLVDRIPWLVGIRWNPSELFGLDSPDTPNRLNLEFYVTNRLGSTPWQQLRVREQNDIAVGVGLGFLF